VQPYMTKIIYGRDSCFKILGDESGELKISVSIFNFGDVESKL